MKISIFGLGYVGIVSAACFAQEGHQVIGVDVNPDKVSMVNEGKSPIVEKDIDEMVARGVREGRLRATTDAREGVLNSDLSLICVGTPSRDNGSLDLTYVERVCSEIGRGLAAKDSFHAIVLRSTVLPGTTEDCALPILEQTSGRAAGETFGICFNPEFLREGTSVYDFYHPPFTIIGEAHPQAAQMAAQLYAHLDAPLLITPVKTAEMMKYVNNAFHALKVVFANEVGDICKQIGVDSHLLMDMFCLDTKLNLSPYYLKPGFAFGGSCLPKDLRALLHYTQRLDQDLPLLESLLPSNELQVKRGFELIRQTGCKKIGMLGFSFKAGTDDLRESPLVSLLEMLIGKGYSVKVYDKNVSLAYLNGANRAYIERTIPHIANLMCDTMAEVVDASEVIVIGNKSSEFANIVALVRPEQTVIDLVRITKDIPQMGARYVGIGW
ncbi:MAG TPA: UDP-glucose/GDP-mannose dehydrogenase family protein [Anaerolineae bacterium]|nr:UDP-glucose/GDP-mannose dehydrogenase family protein [Anaerolineae bacterium]